MHDLLSRLEERLDEGTARGLARSVTAAIRAGDLKSGDRLPPIRTVARELCLSPTTVNHAWAMLRRSGVVHGAGRRGTTVTANGHPGSSRYRQALLAEHDFDLDLANGIPDPELLPALAPALRGITTTASPGGYLRNRALPELLEQLRADWPYEAQAISIVDGAMDAVDLVARALVRPGDRVIVECPTFPPVLDLMESLGADVVGVTVDSQGMRPDELATALDRPAAMVFLQPRGQNPTGASLTSQRARELVGAIRASGVPVLEDDAAGSVATTPPISLGRWVPDQVIHARSFSKSHGAELRLAAVSGTQAMIDEIEGLRQFAQGWTSRILQHILVNFLADPESTACVEKARAEYTRRAQLLRTALRRHGVDVCDGDGINVWVPVADEAAALMRLSADGIAVAPGSPFTTTACDQQHVRVSIGLLRQGHEEVAELIARAAALPGWRAASRE